MSTFKSTRPWSSTNRKLSAGVLLCGPISLSLSLVFHHHFSPGLESEKPSLGFAEGSWLWDGKTRWKEKHYFLCSGFRGKKKADMQNLHFLKEFEVQQKKTLTVWLKDQSTGKWIWIRAHPYPVGATEWWVLLLTVFIRLAKSCFSFPAYRKPEQTFWPPHCICGVP